MSDGEELIKHLFQQNERIEGLEQSNKGLKEKLKELTDLPRYFGSKEQIFEELEAQGLLGKDEEGLQDDFDNAFRMFTEVNPKGQLIQGLQIGGRPASLLDLYQTMDLRGIVWNYGIGWLSAFKGGWNAGIQKSKDEAIDMINNIKINASKGLRNIRPYFAEKRELSRLLDDSFRWNPNTKRYEYVRGAKPESNKAILYTFKRDDIGEIAKDEEGKPIVEPLYMIESTPTSDTYPDDWGPCSRAGGGVPIGGPLDIEKLIVEREEYIARQKKKPETPGKSKCPSYIS